MPRGLVKRAATIIHCNVSSTNQGGSKIELGDWMRAHRGKSEDLLFPNRDGRTQESPARVESNAEAICGARRTRRRYFSNAPPHVLDLGSDDKRAKGYSGPDAPREAGYNRRSLHADHPAQQAESVRLLEELMFGKRRVGTGPMQ